MSDDRQPAAVVLLRRPSDGWILALTRKPSAWHDWCLPGGKWEPGDGWIPAPWLGGKTDAPAHNLAATAARELEEETRVRLPWPTLRPLTRYQTTSGRWVQAFVAHRHPSDVGTLWDPTRAGQPAWVPPGQIVQPWCSLAREARIVLQAAGYQIGDLGIVTAIPPDCA